VVVEPPPQAESHSRVVITLTVWSARSVLAFVRSVVSRGGEMFMR
jgi:hypothetical protein